MAQMTLTCELDERVIRELEAEAAAAGRSVAEIVAAELSRRLTGNKPTPEEIERRVALFERHLGAWNSGEIASAENKQIDADLAREYAAHRKRTA